MPIGDIYQANFIATAGAQEGETTFHWRVANEVGGVVPLVVIAQTIDNQIAGPLKDCLSGRALYHMTRVQRIRPLPMGVHIEITDSSGSGTGSSSLLPRQVSGLINKSTAFAGRRFRGRMYIPFPGESDSDDNDAFPNNAYMTKLSALVNALAPDIVAVDVGTATLRAVIFHRADGTTTDIGAFTPRQAWATQMRRGAFGRPNVIA